MIDIRKALGLGLQQLDKNNPEVRLEVELLLSCALEKNKAYIYSHPEHVINSLQMKLYQEYLTKRAQGIPIAYIIGNCEFWSLTLTVNQHTLIPRQDTELLVEIALKYIPNEPNINVLDLGTGSGAIALALAKERPYWQIDACDLSKDALDIAKLNAQNNQISNVRFYQSNWFNYLLEKEYHAVVSNPPYIDENDPHLKRGDLRFEPQTALVSSKEGLADLQYIIEYAKEWLLPEGLLLLEHGFQQKVQIEAILNKLKYRNVSCWQDLQGHNRVSGGWCPK